MSQRISSPLKFTDAEEYEFLAREYESLALKEELEAREHLRRASDALRHADRNLKALQVFEAAVEKVKKEHGKLSALGNRIDRIEARMEREKGKESVSVLAKERERLVLKGGTLALRVQQAVAEAERSEAVVRMDEINSRRLCSLAKCELSLVDKCLSENATSLWIAAYGLSPCRGGRVREREGTEARRSASKSRGGKATGN